MRHKGCQMKSIDQIYSINCVYKNGYIFRGSLEVDGQTTDVFKWRGQLVTSLMNTLDLHDYIQNAGNMTEENDNKVLQKRLKELTYPLIRLCELLNLDITMITSDKDLRDKYLTEILNFAIWLYDLVRVKTTLNKTLFSIDLTGVNAEYLFDTDFEGHPLVRYSSTNIFLLAQIEFAEYLKMGAPYIVCQKCNSIYFTHKVKSTKTCPFCTSPSLDKNTRAIDKQAERLYNENPETFETKFTEYLTLKKDYSNEDAYKEYIRQLKKRKGE